MQILKILFLASGWLFRGYSVAIFDLALSRRFAAQGSSIERSTAPAALPVRCSCSFACSYRSSAHDQETPFMDIIMTLTDGISHSVCCCHIHSTTRLPFCVRAPALSTAPLVCFGKLLWVLECTRSFFLVAHCRLPKRAVV